MGIFTTLMVFFLIMASEVAGLLAKSESPAVSYWKEKFPNTPIPNTLRQLIVPLKSEDMAEWKSAVNVVVGKGEVDGAKPPRKVGGKGDVSVFKTCLIKYDKPANEQMISDPSLSMYFLEKDLHVGTKMSLNLVQRSNDAHPYFLPRNLSYKIPFSSHKLSVSLEDLNIPEGSQLAQIMKNSIQECESPEVHEDSKYCATSLESMIDFSTSRLGTNHVSVLLTTVPKNSMKQQYTFTGIPFQSKSTSKSVVCHNQVYAYAVYYCHELQNTKTVNVFLKGEDGSSAKGVGLCHEDTSWWNPDHLAFKLLNVKPGGPPICHIIPNDDVVWLPAN